MVVLWNPTIRKSVGIVVPDVMITLHSDVVIGFVVCPNAGDPKLVKIRQNKIQGGDTLYCVSWEEVEVFTLSSGDWRSISTIDMPYKTVHLSGQQVFINGVIYWHGYDRLAMAWENRHNRIISFDLKNEEFGEVFLSDSLVRSPGFLSLFKLMDSLVVIESYREAKNPVNVVWKVLHGLYTKIYTVKLRDGVGFSEVLEFRKNGELIIYVSDDYDET
ncbi:uncharacterized protein [Rutidosis leptorrhynchoides]|uniref:uncharacterized protein n=1 Tax=Rutidosis leptorrhynchoides TaxID=125765 RepID=UPI003A99A8EF